MNKNKKEQIIVYRTDDFFNEVDGVDFHLEVIETSKENYSINIVDENNGEYNLKFNLSIKENLQEFCDTLEIKASKLALQKSRGNEIHTLYSEFEELIETILLEIRAMNNKEEEDGLDIGEDLSSEDFIENELIATLSEEENFDNKEEITSRFNEAFENHKIEELNINSIYLMNGKLKIMTSNGGNKVIEGGISEALQLVLDYVEGLSKIFVNGNNIQETILFNYDNYRKGMNLIGIHGDGSEVKEQPVFEEFFTVVGVDGNFNKTTFGHWIKKNFGNEGEIIRIQFRI